MGKHALLVNGSYLPTVGGVENSIRSIAAELVKEGWKVDVVCSDEGKYSRYEKTNNVSVYRYAKKGFFRSLYNSFRVLKEINKKYQLIICRNHTLFIILKFAGYKNIHYIIPGVYHYQNKSEMRGSLSKKIKYASNVFIQIVSFNISKLKYVFSPTMEDQVCSVSIFNKSVKKIYPGVDDTRFYKLDRKLKNNLKLALGFDNDSKIVLGLGRFVDVKNFEHLIKCVPYLPCDYKVVLVGGGDNLTVYKKIIGELNLINRVFIFESTLEP
ncbi:TPA: glycosyltransferase family 4 protein, partial [Escherichia coli]|nr:glycosyltransferase family 4 protein [Escherichia coli]